MTAESGTGSIEPGWYHMTGDPAGTSRFWDGSRWQGEPTKSPGTQIFYVDPEEEATTSMAHVAHAQHARNTVQEDHGVDAKSSAGRRLLRHATFSESLRGHALSLSFASFIMLAVFTWLASTYRSGKTPPDRFSEFFENDRGYAPGNVMLVIAGVLAVVLLLQVVAAISARPWLLAFAAAGLAFCWIVATYYMWTQYPDGERPRIRQRAILTVVMLTYVALVIEALFVGLDSRARRRRFLHQ